MALPTELPAETVDYRTAIAKRVIRGFDGGVMGWAETFSAPKTGTLALEPDALVFRAPDGGTVAHQLDRLTSIQGSSRTIIIKARGKPACAFRFARASMRFWQRALKERLRASYREAGRGEIVEFYPRVTAMGPGSSRLASVRRPRLSHAQRDGSPTSATGNPNPGGRSISSVQHDPTSPPSGFYNLASWIARTSWNLLAGVEVEGLEHVPPTGPFLLVSNHESNLDPLLIQAACTRVVAAMAKSTQFNTPVAGTLVRLLHGFPVRRYQIDPQAVRTALRLLDAGTPVAIYLEGERSWDGRPKRPRHGTIRLIQRANVPILPCAITGAYDAWPRWASFPQRLPVRIRFGQTFEPPTPLTGREAATGFESAAATLTDAIRGLRADPRSGV